MVHHFLPFRGAGCSLMAGDLKDIFRHVSPTILPSKCFTGRRVFIVCYCVNKFAWWVVLSARHTQAVWGDVDFSISSDSSLRL